MYLDKFAPSEERSVFRIGTFARINRHKPLLKLIEAFCLFKKAYDGPAVLHVFGFVQDPEYFETLLTTLRNAGVQDSVIFEGHATDMLQSIREKEINLVWALSNFDFIGYASIEVGLRGVPIILANIDGNDALTRSNKQNIPPYFYEPAEMASYTIEIQPKVATFGKNLMNYLEKKHDIRKNMKNYEVYLEDLLK